MVKMFHLLGEDWALKPSDHVTFATEMVIAGGFLIVWVLVILLRVHYPKFTKIGGTELIIGVPFIILKGVFDGLDTISPDNFKIIFDSLESSFLFIGLILLGVGLLRIANHSAKIWEVR